jgi:hypothetical protein
LGKKSFNKKPKIHFSLDLNNNKRQAKTTPFFQKSAQNLPPGPEMFKKIILLIPNQNHV